MADLVITPANVVPGAGAIVDFSRRAGEAIAAGKTVYLSSATKKWMLADTNSATVEARRASGVAVASAALDQPLAVQTDGDVALGAVLTAGAAYYGSDTPGGLCPVADVGPGEAVCLIGMAKSATVLAIGVQYPGVML